jgi:hypothetical protein
MGTLFATDAGRGSIAFHGPDWLRNVSNNARVRLARGEAVTIGCGVYRVCRICHDVVRVNKPIVGDLHLCA